MVPISCLLLTADCLLPTASCRLPTSYSRAHLDQFQACRGATESAGHEDLIAGPCACTQNCCSGNDLANHDRIDDDSSFRLRDIAAGECHAVLICQCKVSCGEFVFEFVSQSFSRHTER